MHPGSYEVYLELVVERFEQIASCITLVEHLRSVKAIMHKFKYNQP